MATQIIAFDSTTIDTTVSLVKKFYPNKPLLVLAYENDSTCDRGYRSVKISDLRIESYELRPTVTGRGEAKMERIPLTYVIVINGVTETRKRLSNLLALFEALTRIPGSEWRFVELTEEGIESISSYH